MDKKAIFVRKVNRKDTIELEVELRKTVKELKRMVVGSRNSIHTANFSLYCRGKRLSEEKSLGFYGIEEYDLLIFDRNQKEREIFPESQEEILEGKRWLEKNIGVDKKNLELIEYSQQEDGSRKVSFEINEEEYGLTISEGRIREYDCKKR
ncbi:MAG: hypothetical protein KGY76_06935 [Candidatus Thermoplasmatota archaeon]|nr:hypothetical protein [Candidatus Thermoplasmatota archaeon]